MLISLCGSLQPRSCGRLCQQPHCLRPGMGPEGRQPVLGKGEQWE